MQIKSNVLEQLFLERKRLDHPPKADDKVSGIGIARFIVSSHSHVETILNLAKEILLIINLQSNSNMAWPSIDKWKQLLPDSFIQNFAPELTEYELKEQSVQWESLPYDKKIESASKQEAWTLSNWLAWLEPNQRIWFWWNAILFEEPIKDTHFVIEVTVLDDPFLSGSLKWLFKACGALDVVSEDDI